MSPSHHFNLAVAGAGFAGSLTAMVARRLGMSVALLERGRHPRFAIGESSTPLANLLLEELADEFGLPFLRAFSKWGTWQAEYPNIGCGLKRGFTFFQHTLGQRFPDDPDAARQRQLLVGASPHDRVADTHWYRPDFDHYLVKRAQALGVDYRDETDIEHMTEGPAGVILTTRRGGRRIKVTADFLVDATGPRGFLHRHLNLPEAPVQGFPATQGLYSHFTDVAPLPPAFLARAQPYPADAAAVHHVFDGGWIWVLRFNNGITSAGVAAIDSVANRFGLRSGEAGWHNLMRELPSVARMFARSRPVIPFIWQPRLPFQSQVLTGSRWALLPSAAGVIDPLLSTGFPLTLLGIQRLARLLGRFGHADFADGLRAYAQATRKEFETTARLVGALYARMPHFEQFKDLSLLYFAAASFSETARRLGRAALAPGFLLCDHPGFAPQLRSLCELPAEDSSQAQRIREAVRPFDVAGLTDASRDPWYPAQAADVLRNAGKVNATDTDIRAMLARCGFQDASPGA